MAGKTGRWPAHQSVGAKHRYRPTILEAAGLGAPAHMQGASLVPLLSRGETDWRDRIFYEYYWEMDFPQTPTMFGVRTERYKYIRYHGIWDTNEFYDLLNDRAKPII